MLDFLLVLATAAVTYFFMLLVVVPWCKKRPVKGAFVRPRD